MFALYLGEDTYEYNGVSYVKGIVQEISKGDESRIEASGKFIVSETRESLDGLAYKPRTYLKSPIHAIPETYTDYNIMFKRSGGGIGDIIGVLSTVELLKKDQNFKSTIACADSLHSFIRLFPCVDEPMSFADARHAEKYMNCDVIIDFVNTVENNNDRKVRDYYDLYKEKLGGNFKNKPVVLPKFDLNRTDSIDQWFNDRRLAQDNFIIVHTGGSSNLRKWNASNWKALCYKIVNETNYKVVITCTELDYYFDDFSNGIFACNKFTLPQLVNLTSRAKLIVTTDTGMIHIAGLLEKNTVGIFGNTAPSSVISYYKNMVTVSGDCPESPCFGLRNSDCSFYSSQPECMSKITVDTVINAMFKFNLSRKAKRVNYVIPEILDKQNIYSEQFGYSYTKLKDFKIIKTGKNILYITQSEHKAYSGGRYYGWMNAKILSKRGFNVYVYTNKLPPFYKDFEGGYYKGNFTVIIDPEFEINKLNPTNFDYVIGEPYNTGIMAVEYGKKCNAKIINYVYETPNYISEYRKGDDTNEGFWTVHKNALLESNYIITLSELGTEKLKEWDYKFKEINVISVEPSINMGALHYYKDKDLEEIYDFCFISMHKNYKNTEFCIEGILKAKPGASIALIGHDNSKAAQKYSTCTSKISVFENCSDLEKFKVLKQSKVVVCPSSFEGYGMSVIEAIFCGKNVVATDLPITRLNVEDYPYYFENQNMNNFIYALAKAYNNPRNPDYKSYANKHSNVETLKKLVEIFSTEFNDNIETMPICHMTTYNEQCGIAENTEYFAKLHIESNPNVKVFAPSDGKILGKDEPYIIRNWNRDFGNYEFLFNNIFDNNFRIVHIQHEFSFFRREQGLTNLIKFLKKLKIAGIKTVITYHTFFPGNDIHYKLSQLVDATTICNLSAFNKFKNEIPRLNHINLPILKFPKMKKEEARDKVLNTYGLNLRAKTVFAVHGFWQNHKGYHVVLQTLAEYKKIDDDFLLLILGTFDTNSDYASQIRYMIKTFDLGKNVIIVNKYYPMETVNLFLQCVDLIFYHYFVNTHYSASAAARTGISAYAPLLTSDSLMFADLIEAIPEFLHCKINNIKEFLQKILIFKESDPSNLCRSLEAYMNKNTPDLILKKYLDLYRKLVKE